MVLAVSSERWSELHELCVSEAVEATAIGRFVPTGRLQLRYEGQQVADLDMGFLHEGRPPVVRQAIYKPRDASPLLVAGEAHHGDTDSRNKETLPGWKRNYNDDLLRILSSLNVASKEWIIRQYDHEVQGGSVIKPLVGARSDGPGDAAVIRPVLSSRQGVAVSCGMNPRFGDFDTYHMAASAIDEAVRNCVAVGADPRRIAILDNFCWGDCERPETLGSLVRAAIACHDVAIAFGTPFISGKDSLNNEFTYLDVQGRRQTIAIPPSLLISALGLVPDVAQCVTMDLKEPGNLLYLVGATQNELGGSHFALVNGFVGGHVPTVNLETAPKTFGAMHAAIRGGLVRACHDLSEGGLAIAAAEMAFAGGLGAQIQVDAISGDGLDGDSATRLFSESNSRFLCEVPAEQAATFESAFNGVPTAKIGEVTSERVLVITNGTNRVIHADINTLKAAWQAPLRW
jgi:phosphoribosylformylglycinamidine synthase